MELDPGKCQVESSTGEIRNAGPERIHITCRRRGVSLEHHQASNIDQARELHGNFNTSIGPFSASPCHMTRTLRLQHDMCGVTCLPNDQVLSRVQSACRCGVW